MSAFVVDKAHIDALVTAGLAWPRDELRWMTRDTTADDWTGDYAAYCATIRNLTRQLTRETADEVGRMLWAENVRIVQGRYPDTVESGEYPGPIDFCDAEVLTYKFEPLRGTVDPVIALKALACYEYQSCEHAEWSASEAVRFCEALRLYLIDHLRGYSDAPWEIADRYVFPGSKPIEMIRRERAS